MAQFFYDFKDGRPGVNLAGGPSAGLVRFDNFDAAHYRQEFIKAGEGVEIWQKTPDGAPATPDFNYSSGYAWGPPAVKAQDVDCLVKLVVSHYNGGNYANDGPGLTARISDQTSGGRNYYELKTGGSITAASTSFRKRVAGILTPLGNPSIPATDKANPTWYRFRCFGGVLSIRSWRDGTTEPSTWDASVADPSLGEAGYFAFGYLGAVGVGYGPTAGTRYRLFQLSFGTDGDVAPSSPSLRTVSGVVTGPNGLPVQRVVRIYARATGSMLGEVQSDAGTGVYNFQTAYTGEVNRVVYDDDTGEIFNDLIVRTTPV